MRFDSCHPVINLIYFAGAIASAAVFDHPVFVGDRICVGIHVFGETEGRQGSCDGSVPDTADLRVYVALFVLQSFRSDVPGRKPSVGNHITLEAVAYGLQTGVSAAAVVMLVSCLFVIFSADKVVYLFGRISPKLSLFLSIILRCLPRLAKQAGRVDGARAGVGRGRRQGALWETRSKLPCRMVSVLIPWLRESIVESAQSMKSRGYSLKGRTAFSIYRFDNRDRSYVVFTFLCVTLTMMAVMLDQTHIYYAPAPG